MSLYYVHRFCWTAMICYNDMQRIDDHDIGTTNGIPSTGWHGSNVAVCCQIRIIALWLKDNYKLSHSLHVYCFIVQKKNWSIHEMTSRQPVCTPRCERSMDVHWMGFSMLLEFRVNAPLCSYRLIMCMINARWMHEYKRLGWGCDDDDERKRRMRCDWSSAFVPYHTCTLATGQRWKLFILHYFWNNDEQMCTKEVLLIDY